MKLYSKESRLCEIVLRLKKGEPLTSEEKALLLTDFILVEGENSIKEEAEPGIVVLFRHRAAFNVDLLECYLKALSGISEQLWPWSPDMLIRYLLADTTDESEELKKTWISACYGWLVSRYRSYGSYPSPKEILPYLEPDQAKQVAEAIANYREPPVIASSPATPYVYPIYSEEVYAAKLAKYAKDPIHGLHDSWVLAHTHGKIEEAIRYKRQRGDYLGLIKYAEGGGESGSAYDYSKYFTKADIEQLYEEGVQYYLAEAERRRVKYGETTKGTSGYWTYELLYAACLENDRGNYEAAADLYVRSCYFDRAVRVALTHNLPKKDHYIITAVRAGDIEFLPLLKNIDKPEYDHQVAKLETTLETYEGYRNFEYCAEIAQAIGDPAREEVYKETQKYYQEIGCL